MESVALALVAAVFAALRFDCAQVEDSRPQVPKPDNKTIFKTALTSDYRFRGISKSRLDPAGSGGADPINNPAGLYLRTWMSTIKCTKDAGNDGHLEVDVYGGRRGEITRDLTYGVGDLTYYYPSSHLHPNASTTEIYGQISYGPAYGKYFKSLTNAFGFADSRNSGYVDGGANIEVPAGHVGNLHPRHQTIKHTSLASHAGYQVGASKDFGFLTGSIAITGTDADDGA